MISLSATVAAMPPGGGTPAGTAFKDGLQQSAPGSEWKRCGGFINHSLAIGIHSITAYNGQPNYDVSTSGTLLQTVDKAATAAG
jgi:hypothetical protein